MFKNKSHLLKERFLNWLDKMLMRVKLRKPPTSKELGGLIYVHTTHMGKDGKLVSVPMAGRELRQFAKAITPIRQAIDSKIAAELAKPRPG